MIKTLISRFKFESHLDLKEPLERLGVRQMFIPGDGQLLKISNDPRLYVSKIIQKSVIAVEELGTEAAAATAALVVEKSLPSNRFM